MEENKQTYKVTVTETLQRTITVNAEDELDAVQKVQDMYNNEEIVLDSEDHINTDIDVKNIDKNINANKNYLSSNRKDKICISAKQKKKMYPELRKSWFITIV